MKRYNKEHLEALLDLMPYPIYIQDKDCNCVHINQSGEDVIRKYNGIAVKRSNLLGRPMKEVWQGIAGKRLEECNRIILEQKKATSSVVPIEMKGIPQYIKDYVVPILDEYEQIRMIYTICIRIYNELPIEKVLGPYYRLLTPVDRVEIGSEYVPYAQHLLAHIISNAFKAYRTVMLWEVGEEGTIGKVTCERSLSPKILAFCKKKVQKISQPVLLKLDGQDEYEKSFRDEGLVSIGIYPLRVQGSVVSTLVVGYEDDGDESYKRQYQVLRICNHLEYYIKSLILLKVLKHEVQMVEAIDTQRQTFIEAEDEILCTITEEGYVVEVNKGFESILGYSLEKLQITTFASLVKEIVYHEVKGHNIIVEKAKMACADGSYRWLSWNIVQKKADGTKLFIASARDVTEQMEAERCYDESTHKLERERDQSLIYATLSHELKTPLNIMLASCEMLKQGKPTVCNITNNIVRSSYMMLKQVNDVIDLTKMGAGCFSIHPQKYNVVEVIETVVEVIRAYLGVQGEQIVFDTMEEELVAEFDRGVMERIVFNLIGDALDRAVAGTPIKVFLYNSKKAAFIVRFTTRRESEQLETSSIVKALLSLLKMELSWERQGRIVEMRVTSELEILDDLYCIGDEEHFLSNQQKCKMELAYLNNLKEPIA